MVYLTKHKPTNGKRIFRFTASTDGNLVDYETVIISKTEWNFWKCNELAERHGCELWSIEEMEIKELKMKEVKCSVITADRCYHNVTIYKFEGITTADIIEQLHCLGIYRVTGIIEY